MTIDIKPGCKGHREHRCDLFFYYTSGGHPWKSVLGNIKAIIFYYYSKYWEENMSQRKTEFIYTHMHIYRIYICMYVYTIYAYTHMYPYYIYLYPYIFICTYIHTIYIYTHMHR